MLKIQCTQCNATLKGKEVIITSCDTYIEGVKYQRYAVTCPHCGGSVLHERFAKKEEENRSKAMEKAMKKTGKNEKQITADGKYNAIMLKVRKRVKKLALRHPSLPAVQIVDLYDAVNELPADEKTIVLKHEDKLDMQLLAKPTNKSTAHIKNNSMLLLTQGIIMSAIEENDEDFFKTQYGAYIVEAYNTSLAVHKAHDYGITAELLLDKMKQNKLKIKGDDEDGTI